MEKQIKIALAGNPNSGKTTLFNALTGSNQFVGNWPGVTVEKKEGKLKKHDDVAIMDLPGIYSLSPYTLEEVVARNYLITERPDAILNIIDGTNLERNLYLTTQLTELGIPVVIAINMMDVVRKNGDKINVEELSRELGCKIVEISALKGEGIMEAAEAAVQAAKSTKTVPMHTFSGPVEHAIAHIEEAAVHNLPEEQQRWYAIKIFERDDKVLDQLKIDPTVMAHIEEDIKAAEKELDDDAESIITNERYVYIAEIIKACYKKKNAGQLSASDKIDRVVTNRWLGLPIFAVVMFLVYWVAMVGVGAPATDWANDGLFGDGWHLLGIGSKAYTEASDEYTAATQAVDAFLGLDTEAEDFDAGAALARIKSFVPTSDTATVTFTPTNDEAYYFSYVAPSAEFAGLDDDAMIEKALSLPGYALAFVDCGTLDFDAELSPGTEYTAIAFGYEHDMPTTKPFTLTFTSPEWEDPSQLFKISHSNLTSDSADIHVIPADKQMRYFSDLKLSSDYEGLTEEEITRKMIDEAWYISLYIHYGILDEPFSGLQADTEYTYFIFGYDSDTGTRTTPVSSYRIRTAAQ